MKLVRERKGVEAATKVGEAIGGLALAIVL
jgi:hypothetical protein